MAVGVASSARDGAPVDAAGDELGDHEVPQIVEAGTHAATGGELPEAMGDPVGAGRLAAVCLLGEDIGVWGQAGPDGQRGLDHAAGDEDLAIVQVDIAPLESAKFAPARTEDHSQAQEEPEFSILVPCYLK